MKNLISKIHRSTNGHISERSQSVEIVTLKQRARFSIPFLAQCAGVILLRHIPLGVVVDAGQGANQNLVKIHKKTKTPDAIMSGVFILTLYNHYNHIEGNTRMKYISPPSELRPGSIVDCYLRDSGGEGQDRSVDSQIKELIQYCKEHNLILRRIYTDYARTGRTTADRKNFDAMIADYQRNTDNPRGLIIWDYARFARNTKDAIYSIATIEHHGVIIHSMIDQIPDGEFRDLGRAIKHMGNQAESDKNSAAVKRMQHQIVKTTGAMFGVTPRGFIREPLPPVRNDRTGELRTLHKWIPDAALAPLVLRAFQMRANNAPLSDIRKATGLYKSVSCYSTFFTNPIYKGTLKFGDLTIENYCDPIVPPELWNLVNSKRRATRPGNSIHDPRRVRSKYILSGLIHCQTCGALLVGHRIKQFYYYACPTRKRTGECDALHIPKEKIERAILESIRDNLTLEHLLQIQATIRHAIQHTRSDVTLNRKQLTKDFETLHKKIINLTNAIAKHGHSDSLFAALDAFETEQIKIRMQLTDLEKEIQLPDHPAPKLKEISDKIKNTVNHGAPEDQQNMIRTFTARIIAIKTKAEIRAMLYYIPINVLIHHDGGLGLAQVPPRGVGDEALIEIIISNKVSR